MSDEELEGEGEGEGEDEDEDEKMLVLDLTPQIVAALWQLADTGLFGYGIEDVADRLLSRAIRQCAEEGWVTGGPRRRTKGS